MAEFVLPATETSDVITVEEAAELSGLSEQTIRRRCSSGEIAATKIGGQWRIATAAFDSKNSARKRRIAGSSGYNFDKAAGQINRTDISELWVPDVLRYQDIVADPSGSIAEAQRRVEKNSFGPATPIAVPKSIYSNRPGVMLEFADRVAYQSVVGSFAATLDAKLPDNVFSSRVARDSKYFLERSTTKFREFKDAVPKNVEDDPALSWIGSTDISSYFDNILHNRLFEELQHAGVVGEQLKTLRVMLSEWATVPGMGLPQGPNASRLLGNFYLAQVDEELVDDDSIVYLRYMDDVRILATSKVAAVAALRKFERLCRGLGLTLSSAKTSVDSIDVYVARHQDGHLDRVASMFDKNAITKSRPELKKILKGALGENSIDVRHAKFSIWRLAKIREVGMMSRVLAKLEILAPVASTVAAYLKPFINRQYVQRGIAEFMSDPTRSYSSFLRTWIYAAMLEARTVPAEWRRLAEQDVKDKNNPVFHRSVAACVFGKARVPRDLAWLRTELRSERDPDMARALLAALAYGAALDKGTVTLVASKHPSLKSVGDWLRGRVGLPSLVSARQDIRIG